MQPVVQPAVQPRKCLYTRCNPLYSRLNEFNMSDSCNLTSNWLHRVYRLATGCTTGWTNYVNELSRLIELLSAFQLVHKKIKEILPTSRWASYRPQSCICHIQLYVARRGKFNISTTLFPVVQTSDLT